jgi:hypothetical protein
MTVLEKWFIVLPWFKNNKTRICFSTQFIAHVIQTLFFPPPSGYFRSAGNPHLEVIDETILSLQSDRDQDVSFFATPEPKQQNITDTTVPENS